MKNKKGPLVPVEISPGRVVKMHKGDAVELGLVPGKKKEPAENKMRLPAENKAESPRDDLGQLPGIGESTVKKLHDMGVYNFEQLKVCKLDGLSKRAKNAIEIWRESQN